MPTCDRDSTCVDNLEYVIDSMEVDGGNNCVDKTWIGRVGGEQGLKKR